MDQTQLRVAALPKNAAAQKELDKVGLRAYTVTWEDTARDKNSSVGDNISDLTLTADGKDLPIIRRSNFTDFTWDTPHKNIMLTVGNEHGEALRQVSLQEYLEHLGDYLHEPLKYKGKSLFIADRDVNVLMSAQACMLPVSDRDGIKTKFLVTLRNYQASVLTLVCTNDGTSAHVISSSGKEKLYHNKDGQRCQLLAERLGAFRRAQGRPDDGAPMNEEEKAKNVILIIQVPLKPKPVVSKGFSFGGGGTEAAGFTFGGGGPVKSMSFGGAKPKMMLMANAATTWGAKPAEAIFDFWDESAPVIASSTHINELAAYDSPAWEQEMECASNVSLPNHYEDDIGFDDENSMDVDIEHAIVSVGEPEGPYNELNDQTLIERDVRYPIRVTLQYYRVTSSGTLNNALAREIDQQFRDARTQYAAVASGSLVLTAASGRTTEIQAYSVPAWWQLFLGVYWAEFKPLYASQEAAAAIVFAKGRFTQGGIDECTPSILAILKANAKKDV